MQFYMQIYVFCKVDFTKSGFFLLISKIFSTFAADFRKLRMFLIIKETPRCDSGVFLRFVKSTLQFYKLFGSIKNFSYLCSDKIVSFIIFKDLR